jgi:hypothetical protein
MNTEMPELIDYFEVKNPSSTENAEFTRVNVGYNELTGFIKSISGPNNSQLLLAQSSTIKK